MPHMFELGVSDHSMFSENWFDSFYVRVSTMTAIQKVGHRLITKYVIMRPTQSMFSDCKNTTILSFCCDRDTLRKQMPSHLNQLVVIYTS